MRTWEDHQSNHHGSSDQAGDGENLPPPVRSLTPGSPFDLSHHSSPTPVLTVAVSLLEGASRDGLDTLEDVS